MLEPIRPVLAGFVLAAGLIATPAGAAVYQADPSNYETFIPNLQPGDTLELEAGTYPSSIWIQGLHGTADAPITIRGPDSGAPAVIEAQSCCNTIQLVDVSHLVIEHLHLDGRNLGGPAGVSARDVTHDVTIAHLHIANYDGHQQAVGIKTSGPAWDWTIRDNVIRDTGTGIYLGESDGSAPFVRGRIEHNLIRDTLGYNMQIKHQNPRPTGIGLPTGDSRTIIRDNVFSKADRADEYDDGPRPNLLVGHFPTSGTGADDRYLIHGNFFHQNPTEALFQGEGNVIFYDNVLLNDFGDAVRIQPHNDVPKRIEIFHNTVVATGDGISVSGAAGGYVQRIEANAAFAGVPVEGPGASSNVTAPREDARDYLEAPDQPLGTLSLFPLTGALSGSVLDEAVYMGFAGSDADFDGNARSGAFRGAYAGEGEHDGWMLALAIKPRADSSGGGTVGGSGDDGSRGGETGSGTEANGGGEQGSTAGGAAGPAGLLLFGLAGMMGLVTTRRCAAPSAR